MKGVSINSFSTWEKRAKRKLRNENVIPQVTISKAHTKANKESHFDIFCLPSSFRKSKSGGSRWGPLRHGIVALCSEWWDNCQAQHNLNKISITSHLAFFYKPMNQKASAVCVEETESTRRLLPKSRWEMAEVVLIWRVLLWGEMRCDSGLQGLLAYVGLKNKVWNLLDLDAYLKAREVLSKKVGMEHWGRGEIFPCKLEND